MKPTLPGFWTRLLVVLALTVAGPTMAGARPFHFELLKSQPAAGDTVQDVPRIRLWFSEPPEQATVSIHVIDAGKKLMPAAQATQDETDEALFSTSLTKALPPGQYTVAWRGMGDDGHVVRGEFAFMVAAR